MRGKVTDQDLTNYALNELPADERLYVESMLGVSEECRGDVYQMLEISEMLKEGFEADEDGAQLLLNEEQRTRVLTVARWNFRSLMRQAAAVALLAAGTAYTMTRPSLWQKGGTVDSAVGRIAEVGKDFGKIVDSGFSEFAKTPEEYTRRLQAVGTREAAGDWQFVATPAVCTPPTWSDMPTMPDVSEM